MNLFFVAGPGQAREQHPNRYLELVHGVVFTASLQSCVTREELFVVITDVGTGHVLVLHSRDTLTDFLTLNACNVGQHAFFLSLIHI